MSEAASQVQRFLLEDLDIRGAVVSLGGVWQAMQQRRHYPPGLSSLLGQMAAVTAAIAGNLKQPGRLTLQIQGHGTVPLMVIDCDQSLNLRGHAKGEPDEAALDPRSLFGDGRLLLTLEVPGLDQPYQSFVPIEGESLAEVFSAYLRRSEQQPTGLWLAADTPAAACLFLQKMPDTDSRDPDGWARTQLLAGTVRSSELLELDAPTLLQRLFPDENIRVYAARPVRHE